MAKEEFLEFDGVVTELLPEGRYRVQLDNDHMVLAYTAGRMKRNKIRTLVGDRVTIEMTPYDLKYQCHGGFRKNFRNTYHWNYSRR